MNDVVFKAIEKAWTALREFAADLVDMNQEAKVGADISITEVAEKDAAKVLAGYRDQLKALKDRRDVTSATLTAAVPTEVPRLRAELKALDDQIVDGELQVAAAERDYSAQREAADAERREIAVKALEAENALALDSYDEGLARVRDAQAAFEDAILVLAGRRAKLDNQLRTGATMPEARVSGRDDFDLEFTPMTMPTRAGQSPTYRWVPPQDFRKRVQRVLGRS